MKQPQTMDVMVSRRAIPAKVPTDKRHYCVYCRNRVMGSAFKCAGISMKPLQIGYIYIHPTCIDEHSQGKEVCEASEKLISDAQIGKIWDGIEELAKRRKTNGTV